MTVLAAEILDTTRLDKRLAADRAIYLLNETYQVFDGLAKEYGVEKIRARGEGYLVMAGLTSEQATRRSPSRVWPWRC